MLAQAQLSTVQPGQAGDLEDLFLICNINPPALGIPVLKAILGRPNLSIDTLGASIHGFEATSASSCQGLRNPEWKLKPSISIHHEDSPRYGSSRVAAPEHDQRLGAKLRLSLGLCLELARP